MVEFGGGRLRHSGFRSRIARARATSSGRRRFRT